ncbi:MAG: bis(5'-nucleosyl)-tetraphosphatase (symmetrical) YqeK [Herbinix sp.]|nr:bis(5'-nucleosyl)-tetraphosphatase (symmetrical) YqeK [Herbinix sp.]
MEIEELRKSMKDILSDSRYRHSVGVEDVCCDLALIHGEDVLKASIAGILHDCAKYLTSEEQIAECERYRINISDIERKLPQMLLHAKLGVVYAKERYGIMDENILNAIEYHTTGRPAMSKLEKIVYIADYIEPNRRMIPNIDYCREIAYQDLDKAIKIITKQILEYLFNKDNMIDPLTKETYDYYVNM